MIPNRKAVIEMTIGLVVMAGFVQADPTFITTCPFVIASPGRYVLTADLTCGAGTGILITSSDVTLALEGHRITAGVGATYAISNAFIDPQSVITPAQVDHVSILDPGLITNGAANAFAAGVFFFARVTQSEVNGITVLGSGSGIDADFGGLGTAGAGLTGLTFTANTLGRNVAGIRATNVVSSTISNNDVSGNGDGIVILNPSISLMGPPLVVNHNIVNGNTNRVPQPYCHGPEQRHKREWRKWN